MDRQMERWRCSQYPHCFLDVCFLEKKKKNLSFKILMSGAASIGRASGIVRGLPFG